MATQIVTPIDQPSSTKRIWKIVLDNGVTQRHVVQGDDDPKDENTADFQQEPGVSIILLETDPMLNTEDGKPILNAYGQPAYEDGDFVGSYVQKDPAKLSQFLALWEQLMEAAYGMIDEDKESIRWNQRR